MSSSSSTTEPTDTLGPTKPGTEPKDETISSCDTEVSEEIEAVSLPTTEVGKKYLR